ncbi:hypothetical protein AMTRI_Chr02g216440 [Amborella trichopoda]|uniref:Uncharacterized protein n=1 Tax=Amborella trichopoda TaxID=13333 RepID=W1NS62_AMBTC|nr:uncharacterized protein LOC18427907 [Amborella trichopoda]ERM99866.1 hypothetical protein AMTR_s00098p00159990 [Amborella trichopoda]|eukprot:XP_006837013.1 uncharacterized protein LOC18427907 [Amborella trichopoda]
MGLLFWRKPKEAVPSTKENPNQNEKKPSDSNHSSEQAEEPSILDGVVEEVRRPLDATVFEFGSVAASADKVTLAGFCPVSDELEPCRWKILPSSSNDAPQFRVVF